MVRADRKLPNLAQVRSAIKPLLRTLANLITLNLVLLITPLQLAMLPNLLVQVSLQNPQ